MDSLPKKPEIGSASKLIPFSNWLVFGFGPASPKRFTGLWALKGCKNKMMFPLSVILTATTGKLLAPFFDVQEFCEIVVGGPVYTHELGRAMEFIAPKVFEQHPQLQSVTGNDLTEKIKPLGKDYDAIREACGQWMTEQEKVFGKELDIEPVSGYGLTDPLDVRSFCI